MYCFNIICNDVLFSILFDGKKARKGCDFTCKWIKKDYCMIDKDF